MEQTIHPSPSRVPVSLVIGVVLGLPLLYLGLSAELPLPLPAALSGSPLTMALVQLSLSLVILLCQIGFLRRPPRSAALFPVAFCCGLALLAGLLMIALLAGSGVDFAPLLPFPLSVWPLLLFRIGLLFAGEHADGHIPDPTVMMVQKNQLVPVPLSRLPKDGLFALQSGQTVPLPVFVRDGRALVNEAAATGTCLPRTIAAGAILSPGCVVCSGALICSAQLSGRQFLRRQAEAAEASHPHPESCLPALIAAVPALIGLFAALLQAAIFHVSFSLAFVHGLRAFVYGVPCMVSLVSARSLCSARAEAEQCHVSFRNDSSLLLCGSLTDLFLGNVGTLTSGSLKVVFCRTSEHTPEQFLLNLAAGLTCGVSSPLAPAILESAESAGTHASSMRKVQILPDGTLRGALVRREVLGGELSALEASCSVPEALRNSVLQLRQEGILPFCVAMDHRMIGVLGLADPIRADTPAAVRQLNRLGCRVSLLTQTEPPVFNEPVEFHSVLSGQTPVQMENAVHLSQADGVVMAVGQGLCDAPALHCADVTATLGDGIGEFADVMVHSGSLLDLAAALELVRHRLSIRRLTMCGSFALSVLAGLLASGLFPGLPALPLWLLLTAASFLLMLLQPAPRPAAEDGEASTVQEAQ